MKVVPTSALAHWRRVGDALEAPDGVHRPSSFSAFLAAAIAGDGEPSEVAGYTVVDAGCGAGLMTIAALRGGAARVVAQDRDPSALRATRNNVRSVLGRDVVDRVDAAESDWTELGELGGDLVVVNPPQRPSRLIAATPSSERHLHDTAGPDGTDALRIVLEHADADIVLSTMSRVLSPDLAPLAAAVGMPRYSYDGAIAAAQVEHSAPWSTLVPGRIARVYVQRWSMVHG
ncbi:MAG: 50S ribosomal protein L11 methyltransferase [Actinomycetota bacterium]